MNFKIEIFKTINGIGAASGLVYLKNNLYIISDNSGFLYQFNIKDNNLQKHQLIDNNQENIPKKDKPDFESICFKNNKLHIFGSGSTKKRDQKVIFDLENLESKSKDLSDLYADLKQIANFTDDELNIEGSFYHNENLYLLNRGNGDVAKNGIFIRNKTYKKITFKEFELPIINNIETSFTDAIVFENKIYFLATSENTTSTYLDGEVYGSILGIIDIETLAVLSTIKITDNQKFEGLTIYSHSENEINFLVCEDNDTEELLSKIYLLTLNDFLEMKI